MVADETLVLINILWAYRLLPPTPLQQLVLNKDQFAEALINSNYKAHCSFSEDFRLENDM